MTRTTSLVSLALLLSLLGTAHADLASGEKKFLSGDYQGARADLGKVKGSEREPAELLLARLDMRVGRYDQAEKRAAKLTRSKNPDTAAGARVLLAELYRLRGRYQDARRELEPLVARDKSRLRARLILGLVYRDLGQKARAEPLLDMFFTDFNSGAIDENSAENLFYVAQAARYLSVFEDANHSFQEAVNLDPNLLEANIEWGLFGLEKYAVGLAEQSFDEVLKIDPNHPDAHAGMAMVKLEQSYDLAAALFHLEKALAQNKAHLPSLVLRASMEIDQNQWDKARATLEQVFAINPMHFEARSLAAAIHWLRDDMKGYQAERARVLQANPEYAAFYHIIARSAVREHRYKEAIELEQEAVKINPEYYEAMSEIGSGYLRLGKEKEGLEWLHKAWKGDEYNVRTYNTLNLFEDEIARQYSFLPSKYFKFRYPNDEKDMLHRYIAPVLERAFEDMVARYRFTPARPVIIELFNNPEQYGVRTVGLPNLGALGVCFGQVITTMSPSVGDLNWGMVIWHELSHVFAIQLSNSRVPRWYTEGLSEYETLIARPEWRREHDAQVYVAMQAGKLPSVAELNHHFMKPNMEQVVVAYYLSALTIEYIAANHGFDKIVEGLKLFGKGLETPAVIERITGQKVADFDQSFRAYLERRLAPYRGTFSLPTEGYDDIAKLAAAADARPADADAQAALALGQLFEGKAPEALAAAERALALAPKNRIALAVKAEIQLRMQALDGARETLEALIAAGGDSFDVRGRLAMIARKKGDTAEAEHQLCAAKKLNPESSYPYLELSEIYKAEGKKAQALAELETYVMLEQMQFGPLKELIQGHADQGAWDKVRRYGEMATFISLTDPELFLTLGRAYLETGDPDQALFTYDSALAVKPALRRPALAHIGRARALQAKNQRKQARKALAKALSIEPENAEALSLRKELR